MYINYQQNLILFLNQYFIIININYFINYIIMFILSQYQFFQYKFLQHFLLFQAFILIFINPIYYNYNYYQEFYIFIINNNDCYYDYFYIINYQIDKNFIIRDFLKILFLLRIYHVTIYHLLSIFNYLYMDTFKKLFFFFY